MASTKVIEQPRPAAIVMSFPDLARVLISGFVIGLITYALYVTLDRYVFTPTLCGDVAGLAERCQSKEEFSSVLAMVLSGILALIALIQTRVYRPLLVVLLVTISLWGVPIVATSLPWWAFTGIMGVIFALTYAAFAWLVQVRNLYLAIGISIAFLIVLRLILNS
jgi:hypothetical protein